MKHLAVNFFLGTSLALSVCMSQAETEPMPAVQSNPDCINAPLLHRLFSMKRLINCSATSRYARTAAWLDSTYISKEQSDEVFRSESERKAGLISTTESTLKRFNNMPLAEFKNITSSTSSSKQQIIDTVDGYRTLEANN